MLKNAFVSSYVTTYIDKMQTCIKNLLLSRFGWWHEIPAFLLIKPVTHFHSHFSTPPLLRENDTHFGSLYFWSTRNNHI